MDNVKKKVKIELVRMWKEMVLAYCKLIDPPRICMRKTSKYLRLTCSSASILNQGVENTKQKGTSHRYCCVHGGNDSCVSCAVR